MSDRSKRAYNVLYLLSCIVWRPYLHLSERARQGLGQLGHLRRLLLEDEAAEQGACMLGEHVIEHSIEEELSQQEFISTVNTHTQIHM